MNDQLIDAMLLIKKGLRKERRSRLVVILICLAIAFGCAYSYCLQPNNYFMLILTAAFAIPGLLLAIDTYRCWNPQYHPFFKLLHKSPQKIIWIFNVNRDHSPFGVPMYEVHWMTFRTLDQEEFQLRLSKEDAKVIEKGLEDHLKHAKWGYDRKLEAIYVNNPHQFLKSRH